MSVENQLCSWKLMDDHNSDGYETECGEGWCSVDSGAPQNEGYNFCPSCGREIGYYKPVDAVPVKRVKNYTIEQLHVLAKLYNNLINPNCACADAEKIADFIVQVNGMGLDNLKAPYFIIPHHHTKTRESVRFYFEWAVPGGEV